MRDGKWDDLTPGPFPLWEGEYVGAGLKPARPVSVARPWCRVDRDRERSPCFVMLESRFVGTKHLRVGGQYRRDLRCFASDYRETYLDNRLRK